MNILGSAIVALGPEAVEVIREIQLSWISHSVNPDWGGDTVDRRRGSQSEVLTCLTVPALSFRTVFSCCFIMFILDPPLASLVLQQCSESILNPETRLKTWTLSSLGFLEDGIKLLNHFVIISYLGTQVEIFMKYTINYSLLKY